MRYLIIMLMIGCKSPEIPQPVSVKKLHYITTIQVQPNGNTWNPKFLPILK